jgi:uncharacterized caspase-like protein
VADHANGTIDFNPLFFCASWQPLFNAMSRLFLSTLRWMAVMALALAATGEATAQNHSEKRVALVIGIGDYETARKLSNPVSDARAVETALKALGFKVVVETDRNSRRLSAALDEFAEENKGADLALVFFAGHGVQAGGRNFLLPTDAKTDSASALEASSLSLERVFTRLAEIAPKRIILLDACRNDPFGKPGAAGGRGGGTIVGKGSDNAPQAKSSPGVIQFGLGRVGRADGAVYGFATAPGTTASDGDGANSPFTAALAAHLGQAGLEFGSVMKLVQMEVYERTRGRQLPYIEDALPDLVFADTKGEPLPERDLLLLAIAKIDNDTRAQVERIAAASDMPLAPLYGALLAAKAGPSEADAREKRLARAAEDFVKVRNDLKTLESSDPEVAALRKQAEQQLSLGAFDAARAALTQAIDVDRNSGERLETRLKERNLSEAASRAARAGVSRTRLEYRVAAADLAAAAALAERWDKQLAWRYVVYQGSDLTSQGDEFGDNSALSEAISTINHALALAPHEERPQDWALTQNNLGLALEVLGDRESGTDRLEEAVAAYRAALLERTRERVPLDWAATQNNLGNALQRLGDRESGTARLEEAVAAFRAALLERTRERVPLDWAGTQNNLGNALQRLGDRESGTDRLEEAVAAYRAALLESTRERVPLVWATTQNNLGSALQVLGERESGTARLEEAVIAFRAALLENTRERVPLVWATTQNNLGNALVRLGDRESGTARLEEAVAAYRAVLLESTRERVPLDWAGTQNNLGVALTSLGDRESGTARLEEAVAAFRAALLERTRERVPLVWATTQNNLGYALQRLGDRENGTARLEEAVAAYRAALLEITRERVPRDWATTQNNLGSALQSLGDRESGTARLEEAVIAFRAALLERTRERVPLDWAATQNNLGNALRNLGERERNPTRLEEAVAAFRAALLEYTGEHFGIMSLEWKTTQKNLDLAIQRLDERTGRTGKAVR